jgi:P4 family phage/plasmid primase-like protien
MNKRKKVNTDQASAEANTTASASETDKVLHDLDAADFDDDQWVGMIYGNPRKLPLSIKQKCFHSEDGKGKPSGVIDNRIFVYLTHTNHIFTCGGITYIYRDGYYKMDLRGTIIKTLIMDCCLEQYIKSSTTDRIFKMFLQSCDLEKTTDELNKYSGHYINFENGMYDAIKQKVYAHNPKIYSTNQLPWSYTPDGDHGSGVETEKFLRYAVPDDEDREMLLEYIGLCCTKDVRQQKMLIISGDGGTGKSTIINLIQKLVGKRNISNVAMSKLQDNFQAIRMMGKLLNSCADLEIDALDDVTMIKKLIGEDSISDSYKGKDIISFDNYAKLLFSTNELPLVRNEKTEGFYRRLLILTMNEKPKERDPNLPDKLEKELPYLLHISMQALHRMYERGTILVSSNSIARTAQLRNDSDTVEAFLSEACVKKSDVKINRKDLYEKYAEWCDEWGRQAHQKSGFFKALRNKGYKDHKTNGDFVFAGLAIKEDDKDEFMEVPKDNKDVPFPE